jgi:ADP-heptose:LPS heptosyltransferase
VLNFSTTKFKPPKHRVSRKKIDYLLFNSCDKRRSFKQLPESKFIEVIAKIKKKRKSMLLLAGPGDIYPKIITDEINLIKFKDTQELVDILKSAKILISCDAGVAQIARYYIKKIFIFFGPTNSEYVFKNARNIIPIKSQLQLPCSPCVPYGLMGCRDRKCLQNIEISHLECI